MKNKNNTPKATPVEEPEVTEQHPQSHAGTPSAEASEETADPKAPDEPSAPEDEEFRISLEITGKRILKEDDGFYEHEGKQVDFEGICEEGELSNIYCRDIGNILKALAMANNGGIVTQLIGSFLLESDVDDLARILRNYKKDHVMNRFKNVLEELSQKLS